MLSLLCGETGHGRLVAGPLLLDSFFEKHILHLHQPRRGGAVIFIQLFAAYSTGKDNKELMSILGEAALTPTDLLYAKFADEFEKRYVNQGYEENRSIEETLDLGWELLSILPKSELKRIKPEYIEKYWPKKDQQA